MPSEPLPDWLLEQRVRVGDRVRTLRQGHQWSQLELAARAEVSRYSIYRTELGTHSAGLDHLARIARALDVPLADLVAD